MQSLADFWMDVGPSPSAILIIAHMFSGDHKYLVQLCYFFNICKSIFLSETQRRGTFHLIWGSLALLVARLSLACSFQRARMGPRPCLLSACLNAPGPACGCGGLASVFLHSLRAAGRAIPHCIFVGAPPPVSKESKSVLF